VSRKQGKPSGIVQLGFLRCSRVQGINALFQLFDKLEFVEQFL